MGIRKKLAPVVGEKHTYLPLTCYTFLKEEKIQFCTTLSEVRVPEGYSSNIKKKLVSMQDLSLIGLKLHDYHVIMQQLLPVAIRSALPKNVRYVICKLCFFFNSICRKIIDPSKLSEFHNDIANFVLT